MKLTDKQLKRFTEVFEIKAKSIIMIDKGRKVTIIINGAVKKKSNNFFLQTLIGSNNLLTNTCILHF